MIPVPDVGAFPPQSHAANVIEESKKLYGGNKITWTIQLQKYRLFAFDFDGVLKLGSTIASERGVDTIADPGLFHDIIDVLEKQERAFGIVTFNRKKAVESWLEKIGMKDKFKWGQNLITSELYNFKILNPDEILANKNTMLTTLIQNQMKNPLDPENPVKPSNTILFEDNENNARVASYFGDDFDVNKFRHPDTKTEQAMALDIIRSKNIDAVLVSKKYGLTFGVWKMLSEGRLQECESVVTTLPCFFPATVHIKKRKLEEQLASEALQISFASMQIYKDYMK